MGNAFVGYDNIIPLLAPADITSTITATQYMDLKYAQRAAFLVVLGNVNSATTTDIEVITLEGATAPTGTEAAIAFNYRKAGALTANTWGAITASGATGVEVAVTDDNVLYWIDLDPDALRANDYRYVRLRFTDDPDMANFLVAVVGLIDTRYKQYTHLSATAAASS